MTADQTTAMWSVISSGSVALVAVVGSVTTAWLDRRARRKDALIARQQPRLERTYLELISYVHRRRIEANAIRPFMTETGQPTPGRVTPAEIDRVRTLVVSIASKEVRTIIDEFGDVLGKISTDDAAITVIEKRAERAAWQPQSSVDDDESDAELLRRIHESHRKLGDIENKLHEQIRRELAQ